MFDFSESQTANNTVESFEPDRKVSLMPRMWQQPGKYKVKVKVKVDVKKRNNKKFC